MDLLDAITSPADVRALQPQQLEKLASEIRAFLVQHVAQTGGHLGPNLGVVELTIAIHRIFDSPRDAILFDTGHQSYVHKILTGRKDFTHLRERGGLSGYGSRAESEHDVIENSHATTALSWAEGIAQGRKLAKQAGTVVAVIGDGALTGGMAWEALNNIAEDPTLPIVIVVNDNGRSYAPTVGGFMRRLPAVRKMDEIRMNRKYEEFLGWGKRTLKRAGMPGEFAYDALRGLKRGVKDVLFDAGIFDSLGIKYIGPIDGHDIAQLEEALTMARNYGGPVVVHAVTEKGRGYKPAELNRADHFHAVGRIHPETGLPVEPERFEWTAVFAEEMAKLARENEKLVGITAAMMLPVGLGPMHEEFPDRVFDVGIAEQHAMTMAAGLSFAGYHPVVALYATFMNRAFDQLLMDVALHGENVTIVLDRAGITGADGPSHDGMWDLALATEIPHLKVALPRDAERLRRLLREAIATPGPTLIRYPKGSLPPDLPAIRHEDGYAVLYETSAEVERPLLLVGFGSLAATAVNAARALPDIPVIVVDPEWALPLPAELVKLASQAGGVLTVEDGIVNGGLGTELAHELGARGIDVPVRNLGICKEFLPTATRAQLLADQSMDEAGVVTALTELQAMAQERQRHRL
ncbi:MAG: 1-deoxy-D-xylulose-5-phosphate synthase [Actinomycetaceae bacterium]|nr:1-deoxy-D-xylulose-5-phosphate synthase [Arcanobacterium sp.]MDD7686551.1 1-deoxy-D-xylulose-5-phosphate synthase [Actinomycetaceae bacterium]MDY5272831.1 1-deoxy-D-xylulose-5-phosphate synthase [Arcanobacterium sp.]